MRMDIQISTSGLFRAYWGALGGHLGPLGALLRTPWGNVLGPLGFYGGLVGSLRAILGWERADSQPPSWDSSAVLLLGPSWGSLGPLGPLLGASWDFLGQSWAPLGPSRVEEANNI